MLVKPPLFRTGFRVFYQLNKPTGVSLFNWWRYRDALRLHGTRLSEQAPVRSFLYKPLLRRTGFRIYDLTKLKNLAFTRFFSLVEIQGLKPWTSALPAPRSNQLSYIPMLAC